MDNSGEKIMFEEQKKKIDRIIQNKMIKIANHIASELVKNSPVWTGDYVQSHEVSVEKRGYQRLSVATPPPWPGRTVNGESLKLQAFAGMTSKAYQLIKGGSQTVSFNNKAPHANFVEYIGWIPSEGKTPPYFVFAKATESARLRKKSL